MAKLLMPDALTVAQDVTSECVDHCTWVDRYVVTEVGDPKVRGLGPYTMASMTHVLEHVPQSVETLKTVRDLMSTGGRFLLTFPHCPESGARIRTSEHGHGGYTIMCLATCSTSRKRESP